MSMEDLEDSEIPNNTYGRDTVEAALCYHFG